MKENIEKITLKDMLSKVPEITAFFWLIKVLCTTVGETFADFLNMNLNFGLTNTTIIMSTFLGVVLLIQFRLRKYIPGVYWLAVVLLSVVGTLITDNLTDNIGISLFVSTIVFAAALAIVFLGWYKSEKTLSIHSIFTTKREVFYWLAVLFTFALGTAFGDLVSEQLNLGYLLTIGLLLMVIGFITLSYWKFKLNSIFAFWLAYILTRPLGASIGDFLSQPTDSGGIGLGTTITSLIFLLVILALIVYLSVTKKDSKILHLEVGTTNEKY